MSSLKNEVWSLWLHMQPIFCITWLNLSNQALGIALTHAIRSLFCASFHPLHHKCFHLLGKVRSEGILKQTSFFKSLWRKTRIIFTTSNGKVWITFIFAIGPNIYNKFVKPFSVTVLRVLHHGFKQWPL